jgi:hypothetical protein
MKIPRWLRWRSGEKTSVTKSDNLKKMRQQTDQRLKQQAAQKEQRPLPFVAENVCNAARGSNVRHSPCNT